jgi:hypothetical protein
MSVLAVSLFASLRVAFKSRDAATASLEPVHEIESVMDLVRAEFESALPPRGSFVGTFIGSDYQGNSGRGDDDVTFYTATPGVVGYTRPGDVKRVELRLLTDESTGTRVLCRRVTGNLLSPNIILPDDEILCRGVLSFEVIYYDGFEWWNSWDSGQESDSLPPAVQVTLELEPFGNAATGPKISRIIELPCTGEPDDSEKSDFADSSSSSSSTGDATGGSNTGGEAPQ